MIYGAFGAQSGEPHLEGYISLPQLGIFGRIDLLVDTGAHSTCIHPNDLEPLGADLNALEVLPRATVSGIGGDLPVYEAEAVLAFLEGETLYLYEVAITIPDPTTVQALPSLLGRDILQHWHMSYDKTMNSLEFNVRHADHTTKFSL